MKKYDRDKNITCPKCKTDNYQGVRKVQYVAPKETVVNQVTTVEPEYLAVYCFYCGYQLGRFAPADSDEVE